MPQQKVINVQLLFSILLSVLCKVTSLDYFPGGYFNSSDVTNVSWAHAVNSQALLKTNLKDATVQMLEADLVMGYLNGSTQRTVIMAHPPTNVSDLSFNDFLSDVTEYNKNLSLLKRKGVKLDFKEEEAAQLSMEILSSMNATNPEFFQFPIWINADVIPGPVNASTILKVNGTSLIQTQKSLLPHSTLSLGWTTRFGKQSNGEIIESGSYTKQQVDQMAALIKSQFETHPDDKSNAQVTFPLRAGIAINSLENVKYLLDDSGISWSSPSVTLWEGSDDPTLNITKLNEFIEAVNRSRVFLDLPYTFGRSAVSLNQHISSGVGISVILVVVQQWKYTYN